MRKLYNKKKILISYCVTLRTNLQNQHNLILGTYRV